VLSKNNSCCLISLTGRTGQTGERGPPCEPPPQVAFSIQGRPGLHSDVIHWDHVLTNTGDVIVTDNHFLRIPLDGTYFLMWSATNNLQSQSIWLVVNDKMVGTSTTTEIASGNHALLQLKEGDTIWLEVKQHDYSSSSNAVTFSGYMIWPSSN